MKGWANIPSTQRYVAQKPNEFHVVHRGETLASIAKKYGMSVDGLSDLNGISPKNRIRSGQKLRVLGKPRIRHPAENVEQAGADVRAHREKLNQG